MKTTPIFEQALAVAPLKSYRYIGKYGFIMIGAKDDADGLVEAYRSTNCQANRANLQVWDGAKYVPVQP